MDDRTANMCRLVPTYNVDSDLCKDFKSLALLGKQK